MMDEDELKERIKASCNHELFAEVLLSLIDMRFSYEDMKLLCVASSTEFFEKLLDDLWEKYDENDPESQAEYAKCSNYVKSTHMDLLRNAKGKHKIEIGDSVLVANDLFADDYCRRFAMSSSMDPGDPDLDPLFDLRDELDLDDLDNLF